MSGRIVGILSVGLRHCRLDELLAAVDVVGRARERAVLVISASAPARCSPGEPRPSTMTSYSLLVAASVADRGGSASRLGHARRARETPGQRPSLRARV